MPVLKLLQYDEETQEGIGEIDSPMDKAALEPQVPIRVFCHPISSLEANRKISLLGFLVANIVAENTMQAPEKTDFGYFSYRLCAKVIDTRNSRVQLGDIDIVLDCPIPKDISPNSYISFDVLRLDLQS